MNEIVIELYLHDIMFQLKDPDDRRGVKMNHSVVKDNDKLVKFRSSLAPGCDRMERDQQSICLLVMVS